MHLAAVAAGATPPDSAAVVAGADPAFAAAASVGDLRPRRAQPDRPAEGAGYDVYLVATDAQGAVVTFFGAGATPSTVDPQFTGLGGREAAPW